MGGFVRRGAAEGRARCRCRPATSSSGAGAGRTRSTRQQLQLVLPIVLLVIFVLLYFTYHSVVEARMSSRFRSRSGGGSTCSGYSATTSRLRWVGFIALFGTAVQTGVVMVIYLEEAVARGSS